VGEAINVVWRLAVVTELILAVRLLWQGLGGVYPALLVGSCLFAVRSSLLILSVSDLRSAMGQTWKMTEPLVWIAWAWIVLELFSKWTSSYQGIGRFGKYLFGATISIALLVSVFLSRLEWEKLFFKHDFQIYYVLTRILMATLAIFIVLIWLFFRHFPESVAPNMVLHTRITAVYFVVNALSYLTLTLGGQKLVGQANLAIVLAAFLCFSGWAVFLTRKGEIRGILPQMGKEEAARIARVNQELLGLMKNFPG
jgi:hypothetical protein